MVFCRCSLFMSPLSSPHFMPCEDSLNTVSCNSVETVNQTGQNAIPPTMNLPSCVPAHQQAHTPGQASECSS